MSPTKLAKTGLTKQGSAQLGGGGGALWKTGFPNLKTRVSRILVLRNPPGPATRVSWALRKKGTASDLSNLWMLSGHSLFYLNLQDFRFQTAISVKG